MKKMTVIILALSMTFLSYSPFLVKQPYCYAVFNPKTKTSAKLVIWAMSLEALGKIGDMKAKKLLMEGLRSNEFFIRAYAAQALGALGSQEASPALRKLVNDRHYLVRISAAKALLRLGDPTAEKTLLTFLAEQDIMVRAAAVSRLDKFGVKFVPALLKILAQEQNPFIRTKIIEQLNDLELPPTPTAEAGPLGAGPPGIDVRLAAIYAAMQDKDWQVRQAACFAVVQFDNAKIVPTLIERLSDKSPYVRATAKESLSKLGGSSLIKVFWEDINDKNPILKISSFIALANLKDVDIIPVLLKEVIKPDNSTLVRKEAARALMMLKPYVSNIIDDSLAMANFRDAISSDNLKFSYKVNGRDLVAIFLEALKNPNDPLHSDAPFILAELKEEMAWPSLRQALFNDNLDTVANVAFVLGELKDKQALDDLIKVCQKYRF